MAISRKNGFNQPQHPLLVGYLGYGAPSEVHMKGRVLRDNSLTLASEADPIWINIRNMLRRYMQRGIPNVRVRARFQGIEQEAISDQGGYVEFTFNPAPPLDSQATWFEVELALLDQTGQTTNPADEVPIIGQALIPSSNAQFGVISDIDDTVLHTNIGHMLRAIATTFFHNARTRRPVEGAAAFYNALRAGTMAGASNPIYYVSSSAWNLYDLIVDFFAIQGIPIGPLFLIDLGFRSGRLHMPSHYDHKINVIQQLLDANPRLNFILIGDSGQKDPEIYLDVVRKNPGRIQTIYIRDVTGRRRADQIRKIIAQAQTIGVDVVFCLDMLEASNHALEKGYVLPYRIADGADERAKEPALVQPLLNPEATESRP